MASGKGRPQEKIWRMASRHLPWFPPLLQRRMPIAGLLAVATCGRLPLIRWRRSLQMRRFPNPSNHMGRLPPKFAPVAGECAWRRDYKNLAPRPRHTAPQRGTRIPGRAPRRTSPHMSPALEAVAAQVLRYRNRERGRRGLDCARCRPQPPCPGTASSGGEVKVAAWARLAQAPRAILQYRRSRTV
jgi:hypothetical protein